MAFDVRRYTSLIILYIKTIQCFQSTCDKYHIGFRLDIYRKIPKDLTQPTIAGAIISICCCVFMAFLFISELMHFISPEM